MTRFNTGNALSSLSEEDFYDNCLSLDQAMNSTDPTWRDRFGVEKPTIDSALKSTGFMPAGFDFVTGGTLQPGDRNKAVYNPAPNGDNNWYRWNGVFPKEIAANSQPNPKDENNWVPVDSDKIIREDLLKSVLVLREGRFALRDFVSVLDYGAKGDGLTDDSDAIQRAVDGNLNIILPPGKKFKLGKYISLRDNQTIIVHGDVIQSHQPKVDAPYYHVGGFDAELKTNILITGAGKFSSEALIGISDSDFKIHKYKAGYCPVIHMRGCNNSTIRGLTGYKLIMGFAHTIINKPSQPDWNLIPLSGVKCKNVHIIDCNLTFCSLFGATLNTVHGGSLDGCYCFRCGDSGLHVQFCSFLRVTNNYRLSPYGDGGDYADGQEILNVNDSQGLSIENTHKSLVQGNVVIGFCATGIDVKNSCTEILVEGNYVQDCQLASITARGGDSIYAHNNSIVIKNNIIKNHGYLHTSNAFWLTHPFRGGVYVHFTYTCEISNNTFIGNNKRGGSQISCVGVKLSDLGFWERSSPASRLTYTKVVICGNTITTPEYRSNYPDIPTGFELKDTIAPAISIGSRGDEGLWGDIIIQNNNILGHLLGEYYHPAGYIGAISVEPKGASGAGMDSSRSITISGNKISGWPCGGIFVSGENKDHPQSSNLTVSNNIIENVSSFGLQLVNFKDPSIIGNIIFSPARVLAAPARAAVFLNNVYAGFLTSNKITTGENKYTSTISASNSSFYVVGNVLATGSAGIFTGDQPQMFDDTTVKAGTNVIY